MNEEERKAHDAAVAAAAAANESRNQSRLDRMNAIADRSDEDKPEDLADTDGVFKDDSDAAEARAAAEEAESRAYAKKLQAEGADETPATDSDTKTVNGEVHYRQIINGQERWQTLKQIRTAASKVDAADEYLRSAAESVKNASRLALSREDERNNVEKVDVRSILRAAVMGDEEAIEKLASVLETRPSEVTPDVVRQIDQRLSFRTELASLESKSKDLLEHPYMGRLFRDRLNEMKAENQNMGLAEAYTSIDQELRQAFPSIAQARTQTKLERKRTLVNVPSAAARQVTDEDEEGEEDVQDTINAMAKLRGQAQAVPHSRTRQ